MSLLFFPEGIRCKNETKNLIWTNEMFNDSSVRPIPINRQKTTDWSADYNRQYTDMIGQLK